jgi:hypothetical protein
MKRYVCTVATGLLLALVSTGTATATLIPLPSPTDQTGTQETSFGDQTVGEQKNDADVTQAQGNGNLNIAPAVGIFGDAETTNAQGNGNTATANVDQSNSVDQSQSSSQSQSLDQSGTGCCDGQSQTGEQKIAGGDQTVGEQTNDADVNQYQGNGNVNVSPAIAGVGDAETTNYQGNGNDADATVTQSNEASQSQSSTQNQYVGQDGGSCCHGQSQTAEQKTSFGDQTVGEQKNDADVTQKQGNGNVNVSPAIAIFGDAKTTNAQGNGNTATANVDQSNSVDQSQSSHQKQSLQQDGTGCCGGSSQTGVQKVYGGDQTVGEQKNFADVNQWQGNGNLNISPAIAVFGDAETANYQGNFNRADADVTQSNSATQSQSSTQKQYATHDGGNCCKPSYGCKPSDPCAPKKDQRWEKERCCEDGQSQIAEQKTSFGDQTVGEQKNDADVTQKQGNGNTSVAPAIAFGIGKSKGRESSCYSKCEQPSHSFGGDAETTNKQGNWNDANAYVGQSNTADQSQTSYQRQNVVDMCKGLIYR